MKPSILRKRLVNFYYIFLAQGPNIKPGRIKSFRNVNVYPLMCTLMNLTCNPNNGSIEIFEPFIQFNETNNQNENNLYILLALLIAKLKIF